MLLDIVVIVLRETLEASVLIGVLLSLSEHANIRLTWLTVALFCGALGAWLYGANLGTVSDWFEYTGQEVVNASLQYLIYLLLIVISVLQYLVASHRRIWLKTVMAVVVAIAVVREGSELYVFYAGFLQSGGDVLNALTSGFTGLAIGMSVGAISYYVFVTRSEQRANTLHGVMLVLIGSGMVMQATRLLAQANWITVGEPVWDTNSLLPESSVTGQLIYAVFGYEATPGDLEVAIYFLSMFVMLVAVSLSNSHFFSRFFSTEK